MAILTENINSIKTVFSDIKTAIANNGVTVADGTPVTEYASLIGSISGKYMNNACYAGSEITSLTGSIHAKEGDIVLATITTRSAFILPDTLTLLNTSDTLTFPDDGTTQQMSFAYQKIAETGEYEYTINQASAGRIYLNLIAVSGFNDIQYTGKYAAVVSGTAYNITPPAKNSGDFLIWGCSSIRWKASDVDIDFGDWKSDPGLISITIDSYGRQPRQANFLDFGGYGTRTFTPVVTNGDSGAYVFADAVELIL